MRTIVRDLRFGARQLLHQPLIAVAAIASLAVGIGLNTTLFSVVNAVLLRETLVAEPDRLVEIYTGLIRSRTTRSPRTCCPRPASAFIRCWTAM